jgi:hypothetical protein
MSATSPFLQLNFDTLSPYDIAVFEFTSSEAISSDESVDILTSKASYLWAGAIAHVLVNRPNLTEDHVIVSMESAFREHAIELREVYRGAATPDNILAHYQVGINILNSFLRDAGFSLDALGQVSRNVEEAAKRLQEAGLIEDPLKKWVAGVVLSVVFLMPVNFTSTTKEGHIVKQHIESVLVEYDSEQHGDQTERHLKVKVKKAVKIFKERVIGTLEDIVGDLGE